MDPVKSYEYLARARERVFDAIRPVTSEQYGHEFAFGLKSIAATVTHIMISEWYYIARLEGQQVPPYEEWPIKYEAPPAFGVVEAAWREQTKHTRAAISAERDWNRRITWISFPDDAGRRFHISASAGDLMTQLAFHEVHHRAQVMSMLRGLGDPVKPVEDLDYNGLMYERTPVNGAQGRET